MKHLIVVAHPALNSFTLALTHVYASELERLGHVHSTQDLYRMGFDPILAAAELVPASAAAPASNDVIQAQAEIVAADVLTVLYPLWWLSMPAILKGYVDRVFARGFAYESNSGVVRGLLAGKKAVLLTVSGAPMPLLMQSGNWNAVQVLQDTHIFRAAGFELIEHLHFDLVMPHMEPSMAEGHFDSVRRLVRKHFPSDQSALITP